MGTTVFRVVDGPAMLSVRLALFIWQRSRPDILGGSSENVIAEQTPRRITRSLAPPKQDPSTLRAVGGKWGFSPKTDLARKRCG